MADRDLRSRTRTLLLTFLVLISLIGLSAVLAPTVADAAPQTRALSTGTADSTGSQGAKWRRVNFTAAQTGLASFQLSWTGDADMRFEVHQASPDVLVTRNISSGRTSPKRADGSLTSGRAYYAAIWAYAGVGNYTMTIPENVPDQTDTTPPSQPQTLRFVSNTSTSITITWNASSDNIGVSGYTVFRNGSPVGSSTSPGFTDQGLAPGTSYTYRVTAQDAAGNSSPECAPLQASTATAPPATRPNVIVINTDDQRRDTMQYLPKIQQWLVSQGTTFPNMYVSTPACCPSRAGLLSGRYVHNNGQYQQENQGLDMNLTLQRYMHDAGYFTGHSGKYIQWWPQSSIAPHWDRWTYFKGGYYNYWVKQDNTVSSAPSQINSTILTFDRAVDYLTQWDQANDAKPFFMYLAPIAPHSPSTPEPKYANASVPPMVTTPAHTESDRTDKPPFVRNRTISQSTIDSTRTAMIRTLYTLDDQVDKLMLALQARGELDNTLIIFTSDNSYMWGEHRLSSKFLPYEESVHVPMVIRWPGRVAAGAIDQRFVNQVDITPTILAATGVTQNQVVLDGKDILSGYVRPAALSEYYYDTANGNGFPTWAAVRTTQYLYVEYYGSTNATNTTPTFREYYDMVNDPYQLTNLYNDGNSANDPNTAVLSAQLAALKGCVGASCT